MIIIFFFSGINGLGTPDQQYNFQLLLPFISWDCLGEWFSESSN
jgi:hypothetical protein